MIKGKKQLFKYTVIFKDGSYCEVMASGPSEVLKIIIKEYGHTEKEIWSIKVEQED